MAKSFDEILADIAAASGEMTEVGAREFLEGLKDEIETMLEMLPEEEEEDDAPAA